MKRFVLRSLAVVLAVAAPSVALAGLSSGAAAVELTRAPRDVRVDKVASTGTGCPGSVGPQISVARDGSGIVADYDFDHHVFTYPIDGVTAPNRRCTLVVRVNVPPGYMVAMSGVTLDGYSSLDTIGDKVRITGVYRPGSPAPRQVVRDFGSDDLHFSDVFESSSMVWSECGESPSMSIDTTLQILSGQSTSWSSATLRSAAVSFAWTRC